jgi:hypothetical protein
VAAATDVNATQSRLLALLAMALFAYIVVYEYPQTTDDSAGADRLVISGINPATVSRLEYASTNKLLAAELRDQRWQLVKPVPYGANKTAIESLLGVCANLRTELTIPAKDIRNLSDFGLDPPRGVLKIFEGQKTAYELRIGAISPLNDKLYVQSANEDSVMVVDAGLMAQMPTSIDRWRSPYLMHLEQLSYDQVEIRNNRHTIRLARTATNSWQIIQPPPPKRGDTARINQLLQQWQKWPVFSFVSDDPGIPLEQFGLDKPQFRLAFAQGSNEVFAVQFGGSPADQPHAVFARLSGSSNIVLAAANLAAPLNEHYWSFCDHQLIERHPDNSFDRIEVKGPENFTLIRQTNLIWRAEDQFQTRMDPKLMMHFIDQLTSLEAVELAREVVTDYTEFGLEKPTHSYRIWKSGTNSTGTATNRLVAGIDFGRTELDRTFARRHDENAVYVIPRGALNALPQSLFQIQNMIVWNFPATEVQSIAISRGDKPRVMVRQESGVWAERVEEKEDRLFPDLENVAIEEGVNRLGLLEATRWVTRGQGRFGVYQINTKSLRMTVTLKVAGSEDPVTRTIIFGHQPQRRGPYATFYDPKFKDWIVFEFPAGLYSEYIKRFFAAEPEPQSAPKPQ